MNRVDIARMAYAANRELQQALGEDPSPPWAEAPTWQIGATIEGVQRLLDNPGATPMEMHEYWLEQKQAAGWVWGPVKDGWKRTHPCLKPYPELEPGRHLKDHLFVAIVTTAASFLDELPDPPEES